MTIASDVDFKVGEGAVIELLRNNGIDPSEVGKVERGILGVKEVKVYQQGSKDADGRMQQQDLVSVSLHPLWEEGPKWPLIQPGPAFKAPAVKAKAVSSEGWKSCFVLPDMQIGYYHGKDGELVATHDVRAIDLSLQLIKVEKPDLIVLVGDNLDLPQFGKYRLTPAFRQTTQAALDYCTELMFRLRTLVPDVKIVWLAGNHEERLPNYVLDNADAAFGLRQGKHPQMPESDSEYPVLSVPHLCRLDLSDVEYLEGYPANKFYINERLKVIHGNVVKSRGSTSHKYLDQEKTSVLYGHVHRVEENYRSFDKWDGRKQIMAASPGTLARVDGAVPSTKGGIDLHGRPLTVVEDWQQGVGHVSYEDTGEHRFHYDNIKFIDYMARFQGKFYTA